MRPAAESGFRRALAVSTELVAGLVTADTTGHPARPVPGQVRTGRPRGGEPGTAVGGRLQPVVGRVDLERHGCAHAHQAGFEVDRKTYRVRPRAEPELLAGADHDEQIGMDQPPLRSVVLGEGGGDDDTAGLGYRADGHLPPGRVVLGDGDWRGDQLVRAHGRTPAGTMVGVYRVVTPNVSSRSSRNTSCDICSASCR